MTDSIRWIADVVKELNSDFDAPYETTQHNLMINNSKLGRLGSLRAAASINVMTRVDPKSIEEPDNHMIIGYGAVPKLSECVICAAPESHLLALCRNCIKEFCYQNDMGNFCLKHDKKHDARVRIYIRPRKIPGQFGCDYYDDVHLDLSNVNVEICKSIGSANLSAARAAVWVRLVCTSLHRIYIAGAVTGSVVKVRQWSMFTKIHRHKFLMCGWTQSSAFAVNLVDGRVMFVRIDEPTQYTRVPASGKVANLFVAYNSVAEYEQDRAEWAQARSQAIGPYRDYSEPAWTHKFDKVKALFTFDTFNEYFNQRLQIFPDY